MNQMRAILTYRLRRIIAVAVLLFIVSSLGYMVLEGYSPLEAVYMTAITLSTVGFGEVKPLSPVGRLFTIGVIIVGVGTGAYLFSTLAEYIVAGEFTGVLRQRRMLQRLSELRDHYIVCGFGRVGEQVALELHGQGLPLVVVDKDPAVADHCDRHNIPYVIGDATEDETLIEVGIERARGLVAVLDTDADNVFVVLSARSLNPNLMIVARAATESTESKLLKAGADRVVSPYVMAGHRLVSLLLRPNVVHFLDTALRSKDLELWLEEIVIHPDSPLVGKTLEEAEIRKRTGANVLAIIRPAEHRLVDWSPQLRLQSGDVLIVLGKEEQLAALAALAKDTRLVRPSRWREVMSQLVESG